MVIPSPTLGILSEVNHGEVLSNNLLSSFLYAIYLERVVGHKRAYIRDN